MHVNVTVDISPETVQARREILRKNVYRGRYHFMIGTSLYRAFASTVCIIMSKLRLVNPHARQVQSFLDPLYRPLKFTRELLVIARVSYTRVLSIANC